VQLSPLGMQAIIPDNMTESSSNTEILTALQAGKRIFILNSSSPITEVSITGERGVTERISVAVNNVYNDMSALASAVKSLLDVAYDFDAL